MVDRSIYIRLRQHGSAWLRSHVLYADRQLVVLNKPPGLVCQIDSSQKTNRINLNSYLRDIQQWLSSDPRPVHRLDKGTTGCLLVAANQTAARAISQQFRQRTVRKTYLALVKGTFQTSSGRISNHIKYVDGRGALHIDGHPAVTEWRLLATSSAAPLSLVQMDLLTGNKHQLRLHLAACLNAPILGDLLYSQSALPPAIRSMVNVAENRMFLHASEISLFKFLRNGLRFRLEIRAPLPPDFRRVCHEVGIVIPPGLERANLSISDTRLPNHPEIDELRLWNEYRGEDVANAPAPMT